MTWEKLKLLCWKNFTLQRRHPVAGLCEIVFPILIAAFFASMNSNKPSQVISSKVFESSELLSYESCTITSNERPIEKIGFSPGANEALRQILENVLPIKIEALADGIELEKFLQTENCSYAGIEFDTEGVEQTESGLPKKLKYAIRLPHTSRYDQWMTGELFDPRVSKFSREWSNYPRFPPYFYNCFLRLQNDIEREFIKSVAVTTELQNVTLRRFPYPTVTVEGFAEILGVLIVGVLAVCLTLSVKNIIKNVTVERESQMKEMMKTMGLSSGLHWLAWFLKSYAMLEISILGMTAIWCSPFITNRVFQHSNPVIILLFLNVYSAVMISFCFLVSVILKKSSIATMAGSLGFFLTCLPTLILNFNNKFTSLPYVLKLLCCLPVNSGMGVGLKAILTNEIDEQGVGFGNLFSHSPNIALSLGEVLIMMTATAIVQMLLTIYIENVFPGDIGVGRPWHYPIAPIVEFIKFQMGFNASLTRAGVMIERIVLGGDFENEPTNLKPGVRIVNLTKTFGDKTAVRKLNLNIFEGQITVLLGHNGAGKTTTMSMLTGMFPPTSGTAFLNEKDITTDLNEARSSLGLCPQHNVLFDELTVKEHFEFFARLKGISRPNEIKYEADRYVDMLGLNDKMNAQTHTLSGGMKRKVCIGIALCGNSQIVICDEPTSGMDPGSRRALWDLLIEEKRQRTILISTHHMDEADILGDRIAIMAEGSLRTVGSSFFLKKTFGTGYKLICEKDQLCDSNLILDVLREYASDAQIESDTQGEVIFIINEQYQTIFHYIFKKLEDEAGRLRISSFGCSLSTLEEVFLKLGTESHHHAEADNESHSEMDETGSTMIFLNDLMATDNATGMSLIFKQMAAVIFKKFFYLKQNYTLMVSLACLSILLIGLSMSESSEDIITPAPPLKISFDVYSDTVTLIEADATNQNYAESLKSLLSGKDAVEVVHDNMIEQFLRISNESIAIANHKYLIGASFLGNNFTAWFNCEPYHTMPLAINTINRAILRNLTGTDFDIILINKPYNWTDLSGAQLEARINAENLGPSLFFIYFLLAYWSVPFIGFYIKENTSRFKLLQLITGANRIVFWVSSFLFDFAIFIVVICGILGVISVYNVPNLSTFSELSSMFVILASYACAVLPFAYAFSFLFSHHSSGENYLILVGVIMGILALICSKFKSFNEILDEDQRSPFWTLFFNVLQPIAMMFGHFALSDALVNYFNAVESMIKNIFTFEKFGVGWDITMMIYSGFFFLTMCILKDFLVFAVIKNKVCSRNRELPRTTTEMDFDVKLEKGKVISLTKDEIGEYNLVLYNLTKFYGSHLAVNQINLTVGKSECFGLLGVNGAGKTSCFKMLTGDEVITGGDAVVKGFSVKNQLQNVHQLIGYCPQFDALLLDLTGREILKVFSLIRGIPSNDITEITNKLSIELGFKQHLDKKVSALSGGSKRKLSVALALIGDPALIFLDEPTAGMDPGAKRQLWNIINKTRNSGRSIIMTSHSMEECEALCTKIAIMVNGQFKCLGTTQHLKNKFSKGFILTIKAGDDNLDFIKDINCRIKQMFPSTIVKETYLDILTFHITEDLKWSNVFAFMAELKNEIGLEDYSLTQTSLEQVFLFFTKNSTANENGVRYK